MGVPVNKLICASNINNVLTDFINTGVYDRNRQFYATVSPSMDILISSNLERLLYLMTDRNDAVINEWFGKLAAEGKYEVTADVKAKLNEEFFGGFCDDEQTKETISSIYEKYSYTCDTHTAVAVKVYNDYKAATGDTTKTVIASTASPYKFSAAVLEALEKGNSDIDEYAKVDRIAELSDIPVPAALADLKNKPERFTDVIEKADQKDYVLRTLGF
jgi:threonine synthase